MAERTFSFFSSGSILHRIDALSKFLWLFLVSTLPFVMWEPWQIASQVALLFIVSVSLTNIRLGSVLRSWSLFAALASLVVFFHITYNHEGELLGRIWFLSIYSGGIRAGLIYSLRVAAIMGASFIFTRTTSPRALVVGLISLGLNYRYAWMLFIAMVSLPMFESEINTIKEAHRIRGAKPGTNPIVERIDKWKRYMMPLLASALRRVETVAIAMDSRAFGAYPERTYIDNFEWSLSGKILLLITSIIFIVFVAVRIGVKTSIFAL